MVAQDAVVAEPAELVADRHDEQVRPLELAQALVGAGVLEHRVAQRPRELEPHRAAQQEAPRAVVELGQHLAGEELVHVLARALQRAHPRLGRVVPAQPQRGQVHRRRPALRARRQRRDGIGVELDAVDGGEHRPHLLRRERERRRPDLGEPALGAQPRDPQARNGAGDQHEADVLGERVDRHVERPQTVLVGDRLQVVDHDHERSPVGGEREGEGVDRRPCAGGGALQEAERVTPGARPRPRHRRRHGGPEAHEVVVAGVQRNPGRRVPAGLAPRRDSDRLAEAGGRGHERRRGPPTVVERDADARARDDPRRSHGVTDTRCECPLLRVTPSHRRSRPPG